MHKTDITVNDLAIPVCHNSFSQCGEDLIVQYIFMLRGIFRPTYIDIGANDPFLLNNTALFYMKGCRGINLDANGDLIKTFKAKRPNDINLNVGISDKEGLLDFYIMEDHTLSTFSFEEYQNLQQHGHKLSRIEKVKLTTIEKILGMYHPSGFPDFLSLDVEGMDFDIVRSMDFRKAAPKVICVEASEYSPIGAGERKDALIDYLVSAGYYEYANTNLNAIMVKREFWFI